MSVAARLRALGWASMLVLGAGCSALPGSSRVGSFVDDAAITSTVQSRLVEDKTIDAAAIQVETANGYVVLSGVARTSLEKSSAEVIAMKVRGVKTVQNNLALRP